MSFVKGIFLTYLILGILCGVLWHYGHILLPEPELPKLKSNWWAKESKANFVEDEKIHPFKISVPDEVLTDLKSRLERIRYSPPLEDAKFYYGFNTNYLKDVVSYWKTKYDWRKHEKELNKFDGFKTQIDGIDVHFLHVKPKNVPSGKKVIPLLLIHGWPGSVYEFYKIIPMLTTNRADKQFVFEVVCPHIPGYGFSEAPHRQGFGPIEAAQTFEKLMRRLGYDKYYIQGGDWGSVISHNFAIFFPDRVKGMHVNMVLSVTLGQFLKTTVASFFPSLLVDSKDHNKLYPQKEKMIFILREMGYFHLQTTKPDTVGVGLNDSPVGLAAYILEKFSTWVNSDYVDLDDGGLTKKLTHDELLTNVMLYWVTGSITSSMRFYKEYMVAGPFNVLSRHRILVPAAIAAFPKELQLLPESLAHHQFANLVQYTDMPRGGHFAAFEEPALLADDIFSFVDKVENGKSKQ